ncbi:NAD(P)-binding protein [Poronia punctata]|nr:NAD(P)-binding protein [Poronia punctata]
MSTPNNNAQSTWLITGASSGFGLSMSLEALARGHRVIGCTRNISKAESSNPTFAAKGGIWLTLDPGHPDSYKQFVRAAEEYDVDVLVNSAGYAFIGGVEDTSEEEVRQQMEVNYWGPLRAVRAVLPSMRAKGKGEIVLISSGAGFIAQAGRSAYSGSKFAIEAAHEALSREVATLGIRVLIVEPGAFRTGFMHTIATPEIGHSEGYKGTALETMVRMARGDPTVQRRIVLRGDPDKAARAIVKAVVEGHDYLRMILGPDCVAAYEQKMGEWKRDFEATREIAMSTDFDEVE